MDTTILGLIIPLVSGAISALFWALMKEKDRQITRLETDLKAALDKVDQLQDVVTKNTDSLDRVAEALETQNRLHQHSLLSGQVSGANPLPTLPSAPT